MYIIFTFTYTQSLIINGLNAPVKRQKFQTGCGGIYVV